jgi:hypothetical protein
MDYVTVKAEDKTLLRTERIRMLELDLYRAELALEDALSDQERERLNRDMESLVARLDIHYSKLGISRPETRED